MGPTCQSHVNAHSACHVGGLKPAMEIWALHKQIEISKFSDLDMHLSSGTGMTPAKFEDLLPYINDNAKSCCLVSRPHRGTWRADMQKTREEQSLNMGNKLALVQNKKKRKCSSTMSYVSLKMEVWAACALMMRFVESRS